MMVSADDLGYEVAEPSASSLGYGCAMPSPQELGYGYDYDYNTSMPSRQELGYDEDVDMPTHEDLGYNMDALQEEAQCATKTSRGGERSLSPPCLDAPPARPSRRISTSEDPKECSASPSPSRSPSRRHPSQVRERPNDPPRHPRQLQRPITRRASTTGATAVVTARPRLQMRRRITMDVSSNPTTHFPAHHTKAPRRSSMKSYDDNDSASSNSNSYGSAFRQKAQRRVSFGSSATVNHIEPLHETEQDKKELYYGRDELSDLKRNMKRIVTLAHATGCIDEAEETLRGLESYVKRAKQGKKSRTVSETELCNQIMLQLQHILQQKEQQKQQQEHHLQMHMDHSSIPSSDTESCSCYDSEEDDEYYSDDSDDELVMDLQLSAQRLLRRASKTGVRLADKDAAEARAIYLESMPHEQVHAYFVSSASTGSGDARKKKDRMTSNGRPKLRSSALL